MDRPPRVHLLRLINRFLIYKKDSLERISGVGPWDRLFVRGTYHNGSVQVHEYYVLDYLSSIIRSIPGIIIFAVSFFYFFKIDLKYLSFVPRRSKDA